MLSAFDLSGMRSALTLSLPDSAGITTRTLAADGYGGSTATWSAATTVACRVAPMPLSAGEREQAGAEMVVQNWLITLPASTVVSVKDRVTVGSRTFEVLDVDARRSYELHTALRCQEVL